MPYVRKKKRNHRSDHKRVANMDPLSPRSEVELENNEDTEPVIQYGKASQIKKGEDFILVKPKCLHLHGDQSLTYAVFAVLDGHNGSTAATFVMDNLFEEVFNSMASDLSEDEWLTALPQALNTGFVRTNENFRNQGQPSGTTVTFVVVQGWTVTIASVGDSRCILVSQGNEVSTLTVDHRFESNEEERDRVIKKGIDLCRLRIPDGSEVGPLRCFPGGLCLSRSIGDFDVGDFILPIPHVKQIKLSRAGGRFIIASDGVWDSISCEKAAKCCRGLSPKDAAWKIVRTSVKKRGLRDDTTCLVVDVMPSYSNLQSVFWATSETKGNLNSCFPWWKSKDSSANVATIPSSPSIEELFEYDSVKHLEQLSSDPSSYTFLCALCETKISLNDLITVHAGSFFSMHHRALEVSFFCRSCKPTENSNVGEY